MGDNCERTEDNRPETKPLKLCWGFFSGAEGFCSMKPSQGASQNQTTVGIPENGFVPSVR
jgi:hypothetical protein